MDRRMPSRSMKYDCGRAATRYALRIDPLWSSTVGHVAPYWATKSRADAGESYIRTPRIARPSDPCCASLSRNSGNSSRQGMHVGPQKLTITGRPRSDARSIRGPSRDVPLKVGAGWPRAIPIAGDVVGARAAPIDSAIRASVATSATASPRITGRRRRSSASCVAPCLLDGERPRHGGDRVDRAEVGVGTRLEGVVLVGLGRAAIGMWLVLE